MPPYTELRAEPPYAEFYAELRAKLRAEPRAELRAEPKQANRPFSGAFCLTSRGPMGQIYSSIIELLLRINLTVFLR